jgi:hypothetical protein
MNENGSVVENGQEMSLWQFEKTFERINGKPILSDYPKEARGQFIELLHLHIGLKIAPKCIVSEHALGWKDHFPNRAEFSYNEWGEVYARALKAIVEEIQKEVETLLKYRFLGSERVKT